MFQNKSTQKLVFILVALLLISIGFGVYNKIENSKMISQLNTEKTEIKADLTKMIKQYDTAIKSNSALTEDLKAVKMTIVALKDSITATKKADYTLIKHLRYKLFSLEKLNKRLFFMVDSTKKANSLLVQALDSSEVLLENQKESLKLLTNQNLRLNKNIENASVLQLYDLSATGIKLKKSGRLVITTRAKRVNRIRVCARFAKNVIAKKGNREIYVQIFDPKGKLLGKKESIQFEEETLKYSDKTKFFYQNVNTKICILAPLNSGKKIGKGIYKVKVYIDGGRLLGELDLKLK
jgi:hypothetical protein